jgi:acyl-CoA dehydrogenase
LDFELPEEYRAFRDMARRWIDKEVPKSWARELERDEHNYPHALWDKFSEAGFHGIGIAEEYGGQGGDVLTQMLLARELARTLGGLAWIWGITGGWDGPPRIDGNDSQARRRWVDHQWRENLELVGACR